MEVTDDHRRVLRVLHNLDREVCEHDLRLWGWEDELEELKSHGYVDGEYRDRSGGFTSLIERNGYGWCRRGTYYSLAERGRREL